MEKSVVSPRQMYADKVLGRFAEWYRMMREAGLSFDDLQRPIDDADFRKRLVEFWKQGDTKKASSGSAFPIWRTITLGTGHQTADDFRKALKKSGCKIGDWADDILGQPTFTAATEEQEVDLVLVSVAELGFPNRATRQEIYDKAKELGLDPCPAEVGPRLRLQYEDQPKGEWLFIGMKPITASDGNLEVFYVGRVSDDRWLSTCCGSADFVWYGDYRWVFVRRK